MEFSRALVIKGSAIIGSRASLIGFDILFSPRVAPLLETFRQKAFLSLDDTTSSSAH